jgi:NAD(P)-dependent dehydrogenase (short-subunit alcohol dehydrogenase family)
VLRGEQQPAAAPAESVVNNVGSAPARPGGFLSITDDDWHACLTLNLMAAVRATRSALPLMLTAGRGVIISICSANAHLPDPTVMDYSAAKAALANFSKALSKEAGPQGIRANTVSPGPVATDLWLGQGGVAATVSAATGAKPDDVASQAARQMVTGRFTKPSEVADLVVFRPAIVPRTSPGPTSRSTAASSLPGKPAGACLVRMRRWRAGHTAGAGGA